MALDTAAEIREYVLQRGDEDHEDLEGDFYDVVLSLMAQVQRDIITRWHWLDLVADPPGVVLLDADVTSLTVTVAAGTSVAGTLSSAYASSLEGFKFRPTGENWSARVTSHNAAETAITFDAIPEALTAKAGTFFKDEYTLASDLGVFVDGLWDQDGNFIRLVSQERLVDLYPDPPSPGSVPDAFCRLTRRKIRLSHYPTDVRRLEYHYLTEIADPSGSSTLTLPAYLRPILAEGTLALLYQMKLDRREADAMQRYEIGIERAIQYESRRVQGLGRLSNQMTTGGPYGETSRRAYGW